MKPRTRLNIGLVVRGELHAARLPAGWKAGWWRVSRNSSWTPISLGILHKLAEGVDVSENGQAMDAIREVGPGGHYLGCAHTQANFKTAFWRSDLFDYKPFETWSEEGERDTQALATARVAKLLSQYEAPALDQGIREALDAYVAQKKEAAPAAFG